MNNKNMIIGGLLAVVLVMAVGYAAFSTALNITAPTSIGSGNAGDDYWKVTFDDSKKSGTGVVTPAGTATCGTISYSADKMTATISETGLTKPGDSCTYTLTIKNTGQLAANLGAPALSSSTCTVDNNAKTCTTESGHIVFTVTNPVSSSLAASSGTTTMTVKAEYPNIDVSSSSQESASLSVQLTATQA